MKKDIATVDELMRILEVENLTEISYESEDFKINLKRPYKVVEKKVAPKKEKVEVEIKKDEYEYVELLSQGIGRFYSAQQNGDSKLLKGLTVKEGDEIGYILAMGVKNAVISDVSGKIEEIYVADGDIVDFNKAILKLRK